MTLGKAKPKIKQNPGLGFTIYNDSLSKEEAYPSLLITTKHDWETKYRNKRPCITVSHGNIIYGVNGTLGSGRTLSITDQFQKITCSDLISFPLVVECLSEVDLESSTLASIANILLTASSKSLYSFGFQLLGNPTQSEVRMFEKGPNTSFISSLVINVQKQRQYTVTTLNTQLLEQILVELNGKLAEDIKEG